jgi:AraC-like DNA-binding protein/quercetin dioxygenase-like cupin family protein
MPVVSTELAIVAIQLLRRNISPMRHGVLRRYDPKKGVSISTLAYEYPAGYNVPEHAHGSDQLIYATRGVMEISADQSLWLTPPHLAVWIPAGARHRIRMPGAVSMRTLYLRRGLLRRAPESCTVLHISPLFRELVMEAVRIGQLRSRNHLHRALRDLILFQLRNASPVPVFVRLPEDSRALAAAEAFIANQADAPSLDALCRRVGVGVRTMQRIFRKEVGMSFEFWRRQVRLMRGIELLVEGRSVKTIAAEVGYRQPSAFVELFRQTLGTTPRTWVAALAAQDKRTEPK